MWGEFFPDPRCALSRSRLSRPSSAHFAHVYCIFEASPIFKNGSENCIHEECLPEEPTPQRHHRRRAPRTTGGRPWRLNRMQAGRRARRKRRRISADTADHLGCFGATFAHDHHARKLGWTTDGGARAADSLGGASTRLGQNSYPRTRSRCATRTSTCRRFRHGNRAPAAQPPHALRRATMLAGRRRSTTPINDNADLAAAHIFRLGLQRRRCCSSGSGGGGRWTLHARHRGGTLGVPGVLWVRERAGSGKRRG